MEFKRLVLPFVFVSIVLVSTICNGESLPSAFEQSIEQYHAVKSVHFLAARKLTFNRAILGGKGTAEGTGTYEFWYTDPGEYRILFRNDPTVTPGMNFDVRYNGNQLQWFAIDVGQLYISKNAHRPLAQLTENPFLAPVSFLAPSAAKDDAVKLSLNDVKKVDLKKLASSAHAMVVRDGLRKTRAIEFTGGTFYGLPFKFRVQFDSESGLTTRVDRFMDDGFILSTVEIKKYQSALGGDKHLWPKVVVTTIQMPTEGFIMREEMTLNDLQMGQHIDPDDFTFDWQQATSIVDVDAGTFLKSANEIHK